MNVQRSLSRLYAWHLSFYFGPYHIHLYISDLKNSAFCFWCLLFYGICLPCESASTLWAAPKTCLYSILTLEAQILIMQSGVSEVIYFVEKRLNNSDAAYIASHKLLSMAGVKVVKFLNLLSLWLGDTRFEWCKLEFAGRLLQVRKHQPQMREILIKFEEPWKCIAGLHQALIFSDEAY